MILLNLRNKNLNGALLELLLEKVNIFANRQLIFDDINAVSPSGLRLGSPAMTTRGLTEKDFTQIVNFIDRAVHFFPKVHN